MSENTNQETANGLMAGILKQPLIVRIFLFSLFVIVAVGLLFGITAFLYFQNIRNITRTIPAALPDSGVTVIEYLTVHNTPDMYPAAVAVAPDGTLYTGSYATGDIWHVPPSIGGEVIEGTGASIGSVIGLDVDSDGVLYILDRIHPLENAGATIWRLSGESLEEVIHIPLQGQPFVTFPNDIAVDSAGNIYVADIQYDPAFSAGRILRVNLETGAIDDWWQVEDASETNPSAINGLAFDSVNNRLLVTDAARDAIYQIDLSSVEPLAETLFANDGDEYLGLNGITVSDDGTIYVAELALNQVARLENGELVDIAVGFRGGSDVAYDAVTQRIFVNNWDQRWLLPVRFLIISQKIDARLPFSVDAISFNSNEME